MADPLDLCKWRQWGAYHWGALLCLIATLWSGNATFFIIALLCLILIYLEQSQ